MSNLFILILIFVDQITKYIFYDLHRLEGTWLITPLKNIGIAWSLPLPQWIVIGLTVIVLLFILRFFIYGGKHTAYSLVNIKQYGGVLSFFVAGAIGNLSDRLFYHGVRDFVDLHIRPVFNMADVYLSVAVLLLLWLEYKNRRKAGLLSKEK